MNICKTSATLAGLLFTLILIASPITAQRRRPAPSRPQPPAQPSQPAPTFDTVLAADTYKIYGEVRGVGQTLRSESVNDILDPIIKLAAPPRELKTLAKWLDSHADALMSSRLMFATLPSRPKLPQVLVVIEFPSTEEAQKFEPELKGFLPKLLPTPAPESSPNPGSTKEENVEAKPKETAPASPPAPPFIVKQSGALIFISDTPFTSKALRPTGSKLLAEDHNFRQVHERFSSESVFLYADVSAFQKEDQERRRVWEEEEQKRIEREAANPQKAEEEKALPAEEILPDAGNEEPPTAPVVVDPSEEKANATLAASPQAVTTVELETGGVSGQGDPGNTISPFMLSSLSTAFFGGPPKWPEAIGVAINFDIDSYVVRALLVNGPEVKGSIIPFIPQLVSGPPLSFEASSIFPDDTELLLTVSLDYPLIYDGLLKNIMRQNEAFQKSAGVPIKHNPPESPFAAYEAKLGIKIKEDLLPLLGNEIALSMPLTTVGMGASPSPGPSPEQPDANATDQKPATPSGPNPVIAISVRDREAVRALIPRIIDSVGFKGASMLAQTERRDDTELVSYAGVISYAFIGNFLVVSPDSKAVRHVVSSYLNHQTLGSDTRFRNSTRWQPRQVLGQVYLSPELMKSYLALTGDANALVNDKLRDFVSRLSPTAEPVTYALSNEGLGPLHELHIPKNLVMMMIAGIASDSNQPPIESNEAIAKGMLRMIASAEASYQATTAAGNFGTLDQLIERGMVPKDMLQKYGYKFELSIAGTKFEATAVPIEYGKTGRISFFVDESTVVRGADHGGGAATVSDKPVQ